VLVAEQQVGMLEAADPCVHQWPQQVEQQRQGCQPGLSWIQREQGARHQEGEHGRQPGQVGLAHRSIETQAQAAVAGVPETKAQGAAHQVREGEQQADDHHHPEGGREAEGVVVSHQQHDRQQAPGQHGARIAMEIEAGPDQDRIAVEILQAAHLGPGRVDAEGGQREQQVDDPDAEVLAAVAREAQRQGARLRRRGDRLGVGQDGCVGGRVGQCMHGSAKRSQYRQHPCRSVN